MAGRVYHLSVPIYDREVHRKLRAEAKKHNGLGKLAPLALEVLTRFVNGEFVRIAPTGTRGRAPVKRRIE